MAAPVDGVNPKPSASAVFVSKAVGMLSAPAARRSRAARIFSWSRMNGSMARWRSASYSGSAASTCCASRASWTRSSPASAASPTACWCSGPISAAGACRARHGALAGRSSFCGREARGAARRAARGGHGARGQQRVSAVIEEHGASLRDRRGDGRRRRARRRQVGTHHDHRLGPADDALAYKPAAAGGMAQAWPQRPAWMRVLLLARDTRCDADPVLPGLGHLLRRLLDETLTLDGFDLDKPDSEKGHTRFEASVPRVDGHMEILPEVTIPSALRGRG